MSKPEMWSGGETDEMNENAEAGQGEEVARTLGSKFPDITSESFDVLKGLITDHYV